MIIQVECWILPCCVEQMGMWPNFKDHAHTCADITFCNQCIPDGQTPSLDIPSLSHRGRCECRHRISISMVYYMICEENSYDQTFFFCNLYVKYSVTRENFHFWSEKWRMLWFEGECAWSENFFSAIFYFWLAIFCDVERNFRSFFFMIEYLV